MENTTNPFASPTTEDKLQSQEPHLSVDFLPIMRKWERLRILYNALLILLVLFLTAMLQPGDALSLRYWIRVCIGGLIANACYLFGPTVEAYATHFRIWGRGFTPILFLTGLGIAALLALLCIANY